MVTRRTFALAGLGSGIVGGLGRLTSCGPEKATGFAGYAFVANQEGGAIAAVDLGVFAVARHIRVDGAPTAVLASSKYARVYALTPDNGCVNEIRTVQLTFTRKVRVAAVALQMQALAGWGCALRSVPETETIGVPRVESDAGGMDTCTIG